MPGIRALVDLLSLDVTERLVASGRAVRTFIVTDASNASPIVLTTSAPHGLGDAGARVHVVVSSVGGNTAADGTWEALVAGPSSLTLWSLNATTGARVASVGSGSYTTGGQVDLALRDGRVLLGREHVFAQSSPPRLLMVPTSARFSARSVSSAAVVAGSPSPELLRQRQQRSIRTETISFECQAWGVATPPDPELDFDETQVLYHVLIQAAQARAAGVYDLGDGEWLDQTRGDTQLAKTGHEFSWTLTLATPILGELLAYAPSDVAASTTTNIQPADGSAPELGCAG